MIYNKIPVAFGELRRITGPAINYQYDAVQVLVITGLELPETYRVDFCNVGDAKTISMVGGADGVQIPDQLLVDGRWVVAYIVLTGEDEGAVETRYEVRLPINKRPARSDIEPTPAEQQQIDSLIEALNDGVGRAEDAAEQAETAAELLSNPSAEATTLDPGSPATAEYEDGVFKFGIPRGYDGSGGGGGGTGDYEDLDNKPQINGHELTGNQTAAQLGLATPSDIPTVPTKVSQLTNDSGFVNASGAAAAAPVQSVNGKTGAVRLDASDVGALPDSTVIPAEVTESTVAGWGFTKNTGTYSKPASGIPKTDLADAVQTSLGKADTALQSAPVTSVAGKTGAVTLDAGDSTYSDSATYGAGTVGAELNDLKTALSDLDADKITKPASPASGAFLVWNGTAWVAQTLATWQGGSY